jgi:hypothetical protein
MLFLNILAPSVKNELKILAGGLCPHFYGDDRIISMLTYLKQKGVNIILLALDPDKIIDEGGTQEHLERVKKNVIAKFRMAGLDENLFFLSKRPKGSQFIIVDRETLRLEDPHPPWWSREIETFESTIYIKKPYIARYYEEKFNELLSKSEARVFN